MSSNISDFPEPVERATVLTVLCSKGAELVAFLIVVSIHYKKQQWREVHLDSWFESVQHGEEGVVVRRARAVVSGAGCRCLHWVHRQEAESGAQLTFSSLCSSQDYSPRDDASMFRDNAPIFRGGTPIFRGGAPIFRVGCLSLDKSPCILIQRHPMCSLGDPKSSQVTQKD